VLEKIIIKKWNSVLTLRRSYQHSQPASLVYRSVPAPSLPQGGHISTVSQPHWCTVQVSTCSFTLSRRAYQHSEASPTGVQVSTPCFVLTGGFFCFFHIQYIQYNTASSAAPSDSAVSAYAGFEPRAVATVALAARRSNH